MIHDAVVATRELKPTHEDSAGSNVRRDAIQAITGILMTKRIMASPIGGTSPTTAFTATALPPQSAQHNMAPAIARPSSG